MPKLVLVESMSSNYLEKSELIQTKMFLLGLQPDHLMKMGAFIAAYGLFETTLEKVLWVLTESDVRGVRPFTEKLPSAKWFELLGKGNPKLSGECNAVLAVASQAAIDLNEYRNSLVHGVMLPFGADHPPSFLKNPAWHGEKINKQVGDAYIDEPLQDLVLVAAWSLFELTRRVETVFSDPLSVRAIELMKPDIDRAKSYAGEVRYQRALANHEKN